VNDVRGKFLGWCGREDSNLCQVTDLVRGDSDNSTRKRAIAGQSTAVILTSQEPDRRLLPIAPSAMPGLPVLADIIARSPTGDLTYLVTEHCKAFTEARFGKWFRDRGDEAGCRICSAHGLRKTGGSIAAENGATDRSLMAALHFPLLKVGHFGVRDLIRV
jgi:hypothetical protein